MFGGSTLISITPGFLRPLTGQLVRWWCLYHARRITKMCTPHVERKIQEAKNRKSGESGGERLMVCDTLPLSNP
jgi:hypothetical protein